MWKVLERTSLLIVRKCYPTTPEGIIRCKSGYRRLRCLGFSGGYLNGEGSARGFCVVYSVGGIGSRRMLIFGFIA